MSSETSPILGQAGTSTGSRGQSSYGSQRGWVERRRSSDTRHSNSECGTMLKDFAKSWFTVENAKNKFPIIKWLPKYRFHDLQSDLIAGLTVALTVLPQGLAYATIANLDKQYGLYSAFVSCFVYTFLGSAKDITLGPTAIMSIMTETYGTSPYGPSDPTYAVFLSLACGVVQLLLGVFHLGILVSFISYPVINAFTSAAAITIAFGQVKGILGLENIPREFLHQVYETFKKIPETNLEDLAIGLTSFIILMLLKQTRKIKWREVLDGETESVGRKVWKKFVWLIGIAANAIIVVSAGAFTAILLQYGHGKGISITGEIKKGLPPFKPPALTVHHGNVTVTTADIFSRVGTGLFIVPILGLVETIAIGKTFARQNNYKIIPNQELIAIGCANLAGCFVSAYPVTGSFSRTAVNSQSGVRTPLGGMFTGGVVMLSLLFLTPLFKYIPKAALSAVIISAVIPMVDYEIIPKFWKIQKIALLPWVFTFLPSFIIGLEYGILIGIGIHIVILLYPVARPKISVQELDYAVVTVSQSILYPSAEYMQAKVLKAMNKDEEKARSVILDCSHLASGLDYSTIQGIIELLVDFKRKGVFFGMACVLPEIETELEHGGVHDVIIGKTVNDAIAKIREKEKEEAAEGLESIAVKNGKVLGGIPECVNNGYDSDDTDTSVRL